MSRQFARLIGPGRVRVAATAALLLVAGLLASSLGAGPSGAAAESPLVVTVSTDNSALTDPGTPTGAPKDAVPGVLAAKNETPINVTIEVRDGSVISASARLVAGATPTSVTGTGEVLTMRRIASAASSG